MFKKIKGKWLLHWPKFLNRTFSLPVSLSSVWNFCLCCEMRTGFVLFPLEILWFCLLCQGLLGSLCLTTFRSIGKTDVALFLDSIQVHLSIYVNHGKGPSLSRVYTRLNLTLNTSWYLIFKCHHHFNYFSCIIRNKVRTSKVIQWVKAFTMKPHILISILGTHVVKRRTDYWKLFFDCHTHIVPDVYPISLPTINK